MPALEVRATGMLATVQDTGRTGFAALGVGASGAADQRSHALANRLVANPADAATVEVTFGGLRVRARGTVTVAVTGAPCPLTVAGRSAAMDAPLVVPDGAELSLGAPARGLRSYVAVRGGVAVEPVLGSRSTDILAGLGPPVLAPGAVLPVGPPPAAFPNVDVAAVPALTADLLVLSAVPGPRDDWFRREALDTLFAAEYEVTSRSDRIGMRLAGPELRRARSGELPSEGMVPGSVQVPPDGEPVLFLADHPVTGGYPVIAVVAAADLPLAAQAPPGMRLRFVRARARR
ncbi:5-oxoprolinase subunit C family protein [Marinitenerispora sediminis]|uniref:Allophanate hydrolase n=1 Tax=Marinitenerispora sediminis TaxID=1931232 RepID=A0A368T9G2_9ACTN|nr:biotin-dependent carboxyltransferase family protein [Marinitenerispora sediminis]RCV54590.1 allophanate hydrolase [Marinitenerispora sediminis]RCV59855.1 allophanate hydrolase [Marinitenerispora sediminis]RCV61182.1 allophanate hydrolase [Marinitenerispora sediminis]